MDEREAHDDRRSRGWADLDRTVRELRAGQSVFHRYVLEAAIGRGGMGVVWRARDEELERSVALKFLPEAVAADPEAIRDLKRETRRCLELTHRHIVRVYDFVQDERAAAIAMELVEGESLAACKAAAPGGCLSVRDLAPLAAQLCEALDYAHTRAQVVHRDLKPANLLVNRAGEMKVTDFGIARSLTETHTRLTGTTTGTSGTLLYMSPQGLAGDKPTVSDDVYALGATLYELLAGKPPFYRGDALSLMKQIGERCPAPLAAHRAEAECEGAEIPKNWDRTILSCLAKEAKDRPRSAGEVAERLGVGERETGRPAARGRMTKNSKAGREARPVLNPVANDDAPEPKTRSKMLRWVALAAAVVLAVSGSYFGVYMPEQRIELARIDAQRAEQQRLAVEAARLATARGGMMVTTEPAGAEIAVGGVGIEQSPATFKELRLGSYEVTVSKPGYESQTLHLTVEKNRFAQSPLIALQPSVGALTVTSEPAGLDYELASTRLDAAEIPTVRRTGETPASFGGLPVGDYQLIARRPPWPEQVAKLTVKRGEMVRWSGDFAGGAMTIASEPAGVDWRIATVPDGVRLERTTGRTPQTFSELPPGNYTLVLQREGGWPEQTRRVTVARERLATARADFLPGALIITSSPSGAEVWRSGNPIGRTPFSLSELPPGAVTLTIKCSGYRDCSVNGTVEPRKTLTLAIDLEKLPYPQSGEPWENTLGMRFVPVPGTDVLFCIWDVRVQDYEVFVRATQRIWRKPDFQQGPMHPAVNVSWNDAKAFCAWLTAKERTEGQLRPSQEYRLPKDWEWSVAVGLDEPRRGTPFSKDGQIKGVYPWGNQWPPPLGAGNYAGEESGYQWKIVGYNDGNPRTSPVGSFAANRFGLYDMGGNVWQWCEDGYDGGLETGVGRGGSFTQAAPDDIISSRRGPGIIPINSGTPVIGFRVVCEARSPR